MNREAAFHQALHDRAVGQFDANGDALRSGARGLERTISSPHIQKTGLALAGFHEYLQPGRVLILGESEIRFLESLASDARRQPADPAGATTPARMLLSAARRTEEWFGAQHLIDIVAAAAHRQHRRIQDHRLDDRGEAVVLGVEDRVDGGQPFVGSASLCSTRTSYLVATTWLTEVGAVDLQRLKADNVWVRQTVGKLPSARYAVIDEVFKANSAH